MNTTWRVIKVTATEGQTLAELRQVEWWKKNPAWDDESTPDDALGDEFLDAEPGEQGAEFSENAGHMTIDITGGWELSPGDNVNLTLSVAEVVPS
jgi:hypothetical protein